jgi:hypothetical protein
MNKKGWLWFKYITHMCENGIMKPIKIIENEVWENKMGEFVQSTLYIFMEMSQTPWYN